MSRVVMVFHLPWRAYFYFSLFSFCFSHVFLFAVKGLEYIVLYVFRFVFVYVNVASCR